MAIFFTNKNCFKSFYNFADNVPVSTLQLLKSLIYFLIY